MFFFVYIYKNNVFTVIEQYSCFHVQYCKYAIPHKNNSLCFIYINLENRIFIQYQYNSVILIQCVCLQVYNMTATRAWKIKPSCRVRRRIIIYTFYYYRRFFGLWNICVMNDTISSRSLYMFACFIRCRWWLLEFYWHVLFIYK